MNWREKYFGGEDYVLLEGTPRQALVEQCADFICAALPYSKLTYDPRPSWDVHLYIHASCFRETPGKKAVEQLKSRFTTGT